MSAKTADEWIALVNTRRNRDSEFDSEYARNTHRTLRAMGVPDDILEIVAAGGLNITDNVTGDPQSREGVISNGGSGVTKQDNDDSSGTNIISDTPPPDKP
jgi:hypothetical protein